MASETTPEVTPRLGEGVASIDSAPQAGQSIHHRGIKYTTIKEGLAHILVPHGTPTSTDPKLSKEEHQKQQVFYNPIQQFNRDLSVLAIKAFGEDLVARKKVQAEKAQKRNAAKLKRKQQRRAESELTAQNVVEAAAEKLREDVGQDERESSTKRTREEAGQDESASPSKRMRVEVSGNPMASIDGGADVPDGEVDPRQEETPSKDINGKEPKVPFRILDALSATGLRALRYAQEIPFTTSVTANDMSEKATNSIALNIQHNKLEDKIMVHTGNAIAYMYSFVDKTGFDIIDLDPYGTAAPFLDASVQAVTDGGMLCVTCTDSAIFASHGYLEKTYSQYGGLPLTGTACHEGGLRLILHAVASSAARYGLAIEPLLSLSIDYYVRIFVRVRKAPNDVKMLAGKTMVVYHCDNGCSATTQQFLARHKGIKNKNGDTIYKHSFAQAPSSGQYCDHCGTKTHLAGPMYGGPLHNPAFIKRILNSLPEVDDNTYPTKDRIEGMLHTAYQEMSFNAKDPQFNYAEMPENFLVPKMDPAELDNHPFFFVPSAISRVLKCSSPPTPAVRGALLHAGFKVTMSHCKPGSIKTTANWSQIWHIMREWVRQKSPLKNPLKENTAGRRIMDKTEAGETTAKEIDPQTEKGVDQAIETGNGSVENGGKTKAITASEPAALHADAAPSESDVKFEVIFDEKLGKDHERGKYVRYQLAPRENWGPMARAK